MQKKKGMKYVGDSRIPLKTASRMSRKIIRNILGKQNRFGRIFAERMVGRSCILIRFLILTVSAEPPLEKMADPTDSSYIPMPDWYFLFLYQLLKYSYASNEFIIFGTVIIPGLAFGALLLAPFLDRGPERRPLKRPLATGFMMLAIASITYLTWEAAANHDWEKAKAQGQIPEASIDTEDEGYKIAEANGCISCHGSDLAGNGSNPSLIGTGLTAEEIADIARNGNGNMPAGLFTGSEEELKIMAEYLANLKEEGK